MPTRTSVPFEEFSAGRPHPAIRAHIEGGKRIGLRRAAINNGMPQALPKTVSRAAR